MCARAWSVNSRDWTDGKEGDMKVIPHISSICFDKLLHGALRVIRLSTKEKDKKLRQPVPVYFVCQCVYAWRMCALPAPLHILSQPKMKETKGETLSFIWQVGSVALVWYFARPLLTDFDSPRATNEKENDRFPLASETIRNTVRQRGRCNCVSTSNLLSRNVRGMGREELWTVSLYSTAIPSTLPIPCPHLCACVCCVCVCTYLSNSLSL